VISPKINKIADVHTCGNGKGSWIVTMFYSSQSVYPGVDYYFMSSNINSENWIPYHLNVTDKVKTECALGGSTICMVVTDVSYSKNQFMILVILSSSKCECLVPVIVDGNTGNAQWGNKIVSSCDNLLPCIYLNGDSKGGVLDSYTRISSKLGVYAKVKAAVNVHL